MKKYKVMKKVKDKCEKLEGRCEKYQYTIQCISSIATILISVITLVITIGISKTQQEIDKQDKIPQINVYEKTDYNEKEEVFDTSHLIIENIGGAVKDINARAIANYNISYWTDDSLEEKKISVPLEGYFYICSESGKKLDTIFDFLGYQNSKKDLDFKKEIRESNNKEINSIYMYVDKYVRVEYTDCFGENKKTYYNVSGAQTKEIEKSNGEKIFSEYDSNKNKFDIDKLSVEKLVEILSKS